jgi:hypothetical protein
MIFGKDEDFFLIFFNNNNKTFSFPLFIEHFYPQPYYLESIKKREVKKCR